jgi:hypothetical protein
MGERRGAYWVLVRRLEGKRPIERPRYSWKDNIKMDLQDVVWGYGICCCGSEQGQVAGVCGRGTEFSGSIECGEFLDWLRTC